MARKPRSCANGTSGTLTLRISARSSGCCEQLRDQQAGHRRAGVEVSAAALLGAQRNRDRRQAEEAPLDRRRHGAGIQHVIAQVRAVVDAGDHHVVLDSRTGRKSPGARSRSACRRTKYTPGSASKTRSGTSRVSELLAPLRLRSGATTVTSAERRERLAQAPDALGAVAVVVADQNFHLVRLARARGARADRRAREG